MQLLRILQELLANQSLAGTWLQNLVNLFRQVNIKDHMTQLLLSAPDFIYMLTVNMNCYQKKADKGGINV